MPIMVKPAVAPIGIDLGTTNTVLATAIPGDGVVSDVDIPQLIALGETASLSQLPSCLYIPAQGELSADDVRLPWATTPESSKAFPVGALALSQGAKIPGRLVTSAKSWLSVASADRRGAILPWAPADDTMPRVSPLDVQTRLLRHVHEALTFAHHDTSDVTITIPASFDQTARELTLEAASSAGWVNAMLLEEPQAAFYALLHAHARGLRALLDGVRTVLVVDVGGGTTDLTLIAVSANDKGPPTVTRIAVGDHVMLGGDNMDVTLARKVEQKLTGAVGTLDAVSFAHLVTSARLAKETLLSDDAPDELAVTLLSRGKSLLAGKKSSVESRDDVRSLLLDGFFPVVDADDVIVKQRGGLTELGLPYAKEPALPRHIATFLRRHADAAADAGARVRDGLPLPDAVLLNGGVFKAAAIRRRLHEQFVRWAGGDDVVRFFDVDKDGLDRAVARGAAYAGLVRRGQGVRIGAGSARAYFIGVADDNGERALCVAPRGQLEGTTTEVDRTFSLVVGEPVSFSLFTSTYHDQKAGEVIDAKDLDALPAITTVVQPSRQVPVKVTSTLSEIGTLELALQMTPAALERFKLSFSTRVDGVVPQEGAAKPGAVPSAGPVHKRIDDGKELILSFFGNKSKDVDIKRVKDLRRDLEKIFGLREQWSLPLSRELCGVLLSGASRRRRTAEHERAFFQNLGFMLRPGVGAAFDDWRIEQLWPLWKDGVQYTAEKPTWASWFILWRRVAAGLSSERQVEVWHYLKPWLLEQGTGKKGQGATPAGTDEMIRLAASLERIPASEKVLLGDFVAKKLGRGVSKGDGVVSAWPLGRVGARMPLSASEVVDPTHATRWLDKLLELDVKSTDGAVFAVAQLARLTGDRTKDLDADTRARAKARLVKANADASLIAALDDVIALSAADEAIAFGEILPAGLRL